MTFRLSEPLEDYFKAANAHDLFAMLAAFAGGAVVADEGRQYRGLASSQEWMKETIEQYAFEITPIPSSTAEGETICTASVAGTFPGSPVNLQHRFRVDRGKITRLEIG